MNNEQLLHTVMFNAPIALFVIDQQGVITLTAGAYVQTFFATPEPLIGRAIEHVCRDVPELLTGVQQTLRGETQTLTVERGTLIFYLHLTPMQDQHAGVTGATGFATDITDRREAEIDLQDQLDFALRVMGEMGQGLTITDKDGRFEYVNAAYARIIGYTPEDLIGHSPFEFTFEEDHTILTHSFARRKGGESNVYETWLRHADGRKVYAMINAVPRWHGDTVVGAIAVITDMTERKQAESLLAQARDQALEASRLKSEFLGAISHEIRTPMNGIVGMTDLLASTPLSSKQREYADAIVYSTQSLLAIIDDILEFSQLEAGQVILEWVDFAPLDVVESAVEKLIPSANEKQLELVMLVDLAIPSYLVGDPVRLGQALHKLIGNAIKFTESGDVAVHATLENLTDTEATLRFTVRDTGIGIAKSALSRLFQPFMQVDGSATRRYGGVGLGLAIVRHLAALMGGSTGVESNEGQGAIFWFTASLGRIASDALPQIGPAPDLRHQRVLIVESTPSCCETLHTYVQAWGADTISTASGATALDHLSAALADNAPFDLALIDQTLTDMTGNELISAIQHNDALPSPKIILLASAKLPNEEVRQQSGIFATIRKPIRRSHLAWALTSSAASADLTSAVTDQQPIPSGIRVLVAEDTASNRKLAIRQLELLGCQVDAVSHGRAVIEAVRKPDHGYALILMDCQMPGMDGCTATQEIRRIERSHGRRLPIIAMTANAMYGNRESCLAAGMNDYISKPVNLQTLREVLERWLTGSARESVSNSADPDNASPENEEASPLDMNIFASLRELQDESAPTFLHDLVDAYLKSAPPLIEAMHEAIRQSDAQALHKAAHSLKGNSASLGIRSVAAICLEIETISRNNGAQEAAALLQALEHEYTRALTALKREIQSSST